MSHSTRYSRQLVLPGFGATAQDKLAAARVLVIGAGGLGSTVIPTLAGAGIGTIGVIDDDVVELSNLHRQPMHGMDDLGAAKTASAAETVAETDPETVVRQYPIRLTAANALELFDDFDVIVDGSDNFPTRYLANDAAVLSHLPLVWGAVSQYGGQAGVSWGDEGPTYRDLFPTPPPPGSVLSCEVGGVLPTTVGVIGSILASEVIKIITGLGRPLIGRVTTYDALSGGFRELEYARDPHASAVTGLIDYDAFCGAPTETVTASALARELEAPRPPVLIDVREPWEAQLATIPGAVLVPLGDLESRLDEFDAHLPVVAYCHLGQRSASALAILQGHGFTSARHLDGGIEAWSRDVDPSVVRY
jgi:molybdopterin/thiamine biosynthesis adenylyltransferase/rhodanese-related sulfurtransferase